MKKKILSLLITLFLIVMLLVLTGCSNSSNNQADSTSNGDGSSEITKEENLGAGEKINKVIQNFSGGLALVEDTEKKQYVINESGKVVFNYDTKAGDIYVRNGYISVGNYVYDNKGKEILHDETKTYGEVSKSGYIAVVLEKDDISGKTYFSQVEDLKGNMISESCQVEYSLYSSMLPKWLFDDNYMIQKDEGSYLDDYIFNASNKDMKAFDGIAKYECSIKKIGDNWYSISSSGWGARQKIVNQDISQIIENKSSYELFENVLLGKHFYSSGPSIQNILDSDKNVVKDFSEVGGIKSIEDFNNKIYAISETGYIYTMDENLNYIKEPEKTDYVGLIKTDIGIYAYSEQKIDTEDTKKLQVKLDLLDDNLNSKKTVFNEMATDETYSNFLTGLTINWTPEVEYNTDGRFIYSYQNFKEGGKVIFKIYDTEKEKFIELHK